MFDISPKASLRHPTTEAAGEQELAIDEDYVFVSNALEPTTEAVSSSSACDQVQQDVRTMALQVVKPVALMSRYGAEDVQSWVLVNSAEATDGSQKPGNLCPKCHQPISKHCISLEAFTPSTREPRSLLSDTPQNAMNLPTTTDGHGEAWRWIAFCFAACMTRSRGDVKLSKEFLDGAAAEFEEMLAKDDCLILTALNLMLSILHMHDQGRIAESVVHSSFEVAERVRCPDDPIRATIKWMTLVAGRTLQESGHNGDTLGQLERIYKRLGRDLGATNPSTLAALYNFAWMLCFEGRLPEAEEKLHQLYASSSSSLGSAHMQSITALTTLSRAQSEQGNYSAAVETMQKAIRDSKPTLGRSHPHRLESKRRLALVYRAIGELSLMEALYWDVLVGRIKMLGPEHSFTEGARVDLVELLKELGKWDEDGSLQSTIDEPYASTNERPSRHEAY